MLLLTFFVIDNYFCRHVDVHNIFGFNTCFVRTLSRFVCILVDINTVFI